MKYTTVIEIPEDQVTTDTFEAMKAAKAAGKIGVEIGKLGGDVLYFERGDLRETIEVPSAVEISEEQALNASGEMFGPNKYNTGWRPVREWDGAKDPTETRPGQYRQTFNPDGTVGVIEFKPDGGEK